VYRKLPADSLLAHPENASRMSRAFFKKLRKNIGELGHYEALTVRPHPRAAGKYQVLNGHARLRVLRDLGAERLKCDIWPVSDSQARLYLAVLNKLSGSDVPELRMNLLFALMDAHDEKELSAHVPEGRSYLAKLKALSQEADEESAEDGSSRSSSVVMDFHLTSEQHRTVSKALAATCERFNLPDMAVGLTKMAEICLEALSASGRAPDCDH